MKRDRTLLVCLFTCAGLATIIVFLIGVFLVRESWPALAGVGPARFVSDPSWHPTTNGAEGTFGLVPIVVGTLLVTLGSVGIAAPLGIASAIFCHFYAPRPVALVQRRIIELLAGIPSVVYGFWGLVVLVPIVRSIAPPGPSLLAGTLILALMILPTIALFADTAVRGLPRELLQGAGALGLSRWGTIRGLVLPAARGGLTTGVILGTARAVGETMAILMVAGNIVQIPGSPFDPVRTLTANIALEMSYAMGDHRSSLFLSGLVLLALVIGLIALADRAERHLARV